MSKHKCQKYHEAEQLRSVSQLWYLIWGNYAICKSMNAFVSDNFLVLRFLQSLERYHLNLWSIDCRYIHADFAFLSVSLYYHFVDIINIFDTVNSNAGDNFNLVPTYYCWYICPSAQLYEGLRADVDTSDEIKFYRDWF